MYIFNTLKKQHKILEYTKEKNPLNTLFFSLKHS